MSPICYEFTIFIVTNMSLIYRADTLNACAHYVSCMGTGQLNALRTVFKRMTDLNTVTKALSEVQTFCVKAGSFSSTLAQKMAVDGKMSPGMHLLQLHLITTDVLTLKLMTCSIICSCMVANIRLLDTCTSEACNETCLSMCISYWMRAKLEHICIHPY
jgi:hypothetical protein